MRNRRTLLTSLAVLTACCSISLSQQPPPSFLNTVAVGDSLTAGFQSGSLNEEGQTTSYAYLVAQQVGTFMFLPLITSPGIPNELVLIDPGPPPLIEPVEGEAGTRVFPLIVPQNLAVPGQDVSEALTVVPDLPLDTLEDVILGVPILLADFGIPPLSQIQLAFALKPTFTIFWLGSNDVLGAALGADPAAVTPFDVFQEAYTTAVGTVLASGSQIIVANIPDVTVIPFLTPAQELAALAGVPLEVIGPLLGVASGDFVTATGVPVAIAILTGQAPPPLPGNVVLTSEEVQTIRTAVAGMNAFIDGLSASLNFPVVDVHALLNDIDQNGVVIDGVTLTTDFLGGVFTLDGIHPTNTANAVVANAFIERMNAFYGLNIPLVDVAAVMVDDPLVFNKVGPAGALTADVMEMGESEFQVLRELLIADP